VLIQHKNLTLELNKSKSELLRSKLRTFQESTGLTDQEKMYLHQEEPITIKNQANIMNLVQVVEEIAKEMSVLRATVSSLQQDLKS